MVVEAAGLRRARSRLLGPAVLRQIPGVVVPDDRPGAPDDNIFWAGDQGEARWTIYAYQSAWLPASLLKAEHRDRLVETLVAASRRRLGLACMSTRASPGCAPRDPIAAARETAINPAATEAFALAISAGGGPPSWPGIPGHEPDEAAARTKAADVGAAMDGLRKLLPARRPMSGRPTSSSRTGRRRSGATIIRACAP